MEKIHRAEKEASGGRRGRTSSISGTSVSFADSRRGSHAATPEKDSVNTNTTREAKVNPLISPSGILKKQKQSSDYHLLGKEDDESSHSSSHLQSNGGGKRGSLNSKKRTTLPPIPPSPAVQEDSPLGSSIDKDLPAPSLPAFHSPEPKSFTSLNELAEGSIDLDDYTTNTARRASLNAANNSLNGHQEKRVSVNSRNRSMSAATGSSRRERRRSSVTIDGVTVREKRSGTVSGSSTAPAKPQGHYTKQPVWVLGLVCVIAGSLLDFTALAFVDQAVVAPLGSLTLVSNVFFAPLLLKEKVNRKQILCTCLIVAGSCLAVAFAPHDSTSPDIQAMFNNFARLRFIIYAVISCMALGGLRFACWKFNKVRRMDLHAYSKVAKYHTFAYAACAGIMGAQSVLFAKCTAMLLAGTIAGDGLMFVYWGTYFVLLGLGVTIFLQIRWLNSGLRMFSALMIVPIFQSF